MSAPAPNHAAPGQQASTWRVYATLVGIALIAGLAIALTHELTRPLVDDSRAQLLSAAVLGVLPGAVSYRGYMQTPQGRLAPAPASAPAAAEVFAGFDAAGRLIGFAIAADGMGYQDRIALLYGLDPAAGVLLGLQVLESRETPGLGARIVDDEDFLGNFRGLALRFDDDSGLHPLRLAGRQRGEAGRIDGITGATVSARAVVQIVNASLAHWLPRLRAELDAIAAADHG
ncbi:MAG: FMN-binding protein [Pseudomonadales bacterium]